MCMHKMADKLYSNLQQECDLHVGAQMAALHGAVALDPVTYLERVDSMWSDYCSQLLTIRQIFLYLDRTHVIASTNVRSLFDMGLHLLRKHLDEHSQVGMRTVDGLLALIARERQGDSVDRMRLKNLLRMFNNVGVYAHIFERPFLETTNQFYQVEGMRLMGELDVPAYLAHCEERLTEEFERCTHYLDVGTRPALVAAVEKQLVAQHLASILERGFAQLLDAHRIDDVSRLFRLASRVSALEAVRCAWRDYIKATGIKVVKDEEKDKDMVELLLAFKGRMDEILEKAMAKSEAFSNSLKESFENFINQRQNKPAELIAKFIDAKLRAGNKGQTEEELDAQLDKALLLFRYISGKDVFEAFYKKDLAKRLLLGKSASIDAEKTMIAKLKAECGSQFTSKLEGMFKDVELSADVVGAFKTYVAAAASKGEGVPSGVDMQVQVLTSGFWPSYPIMEAKLPEELTTWQQVFLNFYLKKYSGRRLQWYNSLSSCLLAARFPKGNKELSVSLFQTVVLMLFNDADQISFEDIKSGTGIEDKELRRTLQSLACGKVRVLNKEPKGKDVNDGDVFHINSGFSEKLYRIKINSIQMKETEEENKKTNDQVMQDRQYQIDAAIVRIMKTRKSLSHKLLVAEAMQQLKFPLKALDLKKRIESLIDREYLERDSSDPNVYNYLA